MLLTGQQLGRLCPEMCHGREQELLFCSVNVRVRAVRIRRMHVHKSQQCDGLYSLDSFIMIVIFL